MLPYIDIPFQYVAAILGASSDELKLITSFLLSYPLAGVLKRIPDSKPALKNLFIIGVSAFYLVGLFDLWGGVWTLAHLYKDLLCHGLGLSSVWDTYLSTSYLANFEMNLECLLNFAGYVLFFPSLFAGPAFDYVDYESWVETTMFEVPAGTNPAKLPPTRKKRKIPRSGTPATWKAVAGIAWILAFLKLSGMYNPELVVGDQYMTRLKYYGVWALTEGSCILSGLGYKGIDPTTGKVSWDRLQNVSPWGVESAQNTRAYLGGWNINTNNWLRNYMYLRVTPRGKKPGFRASMATFTTSAFWHGFYPGYYLTFVLASFVQTVAKNCRRYFRPFFLDPKTTQPKPTKIYYDVASWLVTQTAFCFVTAPFVLLSLPASFLVWARVYFYGAVGTALATAFFSSPAKGLLIQKLKARVPAPDLKRVNSNDSIQHHEPVLGLPGEPQKDLEELVGEVRAEVELRKRKGSLGKGAIGGVGKKG
ncbi:putative Lysophospholipid acyltransferase [Glarea lozoyensis 74030]|uniref:Putative Lysophospholipid acyltransferase n=1 Tax=Glarea lozoyensis (strain ATCC 74030 / MF5533) TaxID=1104152 RepID=H0ECS1_GLAL7|nr:putative Lysophospholipid acyltransferase [Glarea lozoyensis 74030]